MMAYNRLRIHNRGWALRFLLMAVLGMGAATGAMGQLAGADWTYYGKRGPEHWSRLDPAYAACSKGREQSPVDIRGAKVDPALKPIEFHYLSGPVTVVNTGRTVRVDVTPGSYIVAGGVRYELTEFHFHHPAENAVNGKLADLSANLLHKSADGQTAIVEVRMNEGRTNGVLAALWPSLPRAGATAKIGEAVNPMGLLPADRSFYSFPGSLTVPPCTEGVHWFVMQREVELSGDQLQAIATLYPDNARRLQPTHGRKVAMSQ